MLFPSSLQAGLDKASLMFPHQHLDIKAPTRSFNVIPLKNNRILTKRSAAKRRKDITLAMSATRSQRKGETKGETGLW